MVSSPALTDEYFFIFMSSSLSGVSGRYSILDPHVHYTIMETLCFPWGSSFDPLLDSCLNIAAVLSSRVSKDYLVYAV